MQKSVAQIIHMIGHLRLGAGKHITETMLEQARRGYRVRLLVSADIDDNWRTYPSMKKTLVESGIPVEVCGDFFHRQLTSLLETAKKLRPLIESGPTVLHCHSAIPVAVSRWAGALKVVVTCHGMAPDRDPAFDLQDALAFRLADTVISPSRYWADRLTMFYGLENVRVIPLGLNLRKYPELPVRQKEKDEPWKVLSLCELTRRKGLDLMIAAAPEVSRAAGAVEFHFFGSGDAEQSLKEQTAGLPSGKHLFFFHGRVKEPYKLMQNFDLLCLPTRSDNFPLAVMEAMLAGLPVLATRIGGIPEQIEECGGGRIVEPESPSTLAKGFIELFEAGPARLREIGEAGKSYARCAFKIERSVDALQQAYCLQDST